MSATHHTTCVYEAATSRRREEEKLLASLFGCGLAKIPALHPNDGPPTNSDGDHLDSRNYADPKKVNDKLLKVKLEGDQNERSFKRKSRTSSRVRSRALRDEALVSVKDSVSETHPQAKKARLSTDLQPELDTMEHCPSPEVTVTGSSAIEDIQMMDPSDENQADNTQPVTTSVSGKYVKHDTYWFPNGDILVQIGQVRFKLHSNTLVKHSQWFRDTIEVESRNRCTFFDEETGSTVYCLHNLDINTEDFCVLLNAVDNAISFVHNKQHPRTIAAILRAADALSFEQFKTFAMLELEAKWPSDVDDVTVTRITYAADTVLLARRSNAGSVLKRALYELVRTEGFQQTTTEELDQNQNPGDDGLGKSDYSLLVRVREKIVDFWMKKAIPPSDPSICLSRPDSSAYQNCAVSRRQTHTLYGILIHDSKIFSKYKYDPICGLDALYDAPWMRKEKWSSFHGEHLALSEHVHLCPACCQRWRSTWAEEQKQLWWNLDTWLEFVTPVIVKSDV